MKVKINDVVKMKTDNTRWVVKELGFNYCYCETAETQIDGYECESDNGYFHTDSIEKIIKEEQ